jgi:putative flippase GtrA
MIDAAKLMITYEGVESSMSTSFGTAKGIETFEAMTNSYAIYSQETGVRLVGWYIWKPNDSTITLSVRTKDGTNYPLTLKESTDVDKAYKGIYKNAMTARFSIELPTITSDQASQLIVKDSKGNLIETLQLTSSNQNAENTNRIYLIDQYESLSEGQTNIKRFGAIYVARVNGIANIYQKTGLWFAVFGFMSFLYLSLIILIKRTKTKPLEFDRWMLLLGFALSLIVLIAGVSYTQISAFSAIDYFYLSGGYPLMIAFFAISIATIGERLLDLQNHPKYGKLITQIYRFVIVGGSAFLIDYGLLLLLIRFFKLHYLLAGTISFGIAVIFNYLMSIFWVFKPSLRDERYKELTAFLILSTIGLGINQMAMFTMVDGIGFTISLSKVLATLIVMVFNFISRKVYLEKIPMEKLFGINQKKMIKRNSK